MVEKSENRNVMISVVDFIANERSLAAIKLRDEGKIEEAKVIITENRIELPIFAKKYGSERLRLEAERNDDDFAKIDTPAWGEKRKSMTQRQNEKTTQNKGYRSKD